MLKERGALEEAERLARDTLEAQQAAFGRRHPSILSSMNVLGGILIEAGRAMEAADLLRETWMLRREFEGTRHPSTLVAARNLGWALFEVGRLAEAEELLREVLRTQEGLLEAEHLQFVRTKEILARLHQARGDLEQAEALFRDVVDSAARALPADHWQRALFTGRHGHCLAQLKRYEQADAALQPAYQRLRAALGEQHARSQELRAYLIDLVAAWGRPEQAELYRDRAALPLTPGSGE